jgi:hypothetical protein
MTMQAKKIPEKNLRNLPPDMNLLYRFACFALMLFLVGCATKEQNRMIFYGGDIVTMSVMRFSRLFSWSAALQWLIGVPLVLVVGTNRKLQNGNNKKY